MLRLITALEAASEGHEHLDIEIQQLRGLRKPIPPYTRSVDAALSLLPEGWSVYSLRRQTNGRGEFTSWAVVLYRATDVMIEVAHASKAVSAPLAICAAALRVRQRDDAAEACAEHHARVTRHVEEVETSSRRISV